jgi:hypothetical protein
VPVSTAEGAGGMAVRVEWDEGAILRNCHLTFHALGRWRNRGACFNRGSCWLWGRGGFELVGEESVCVSAGGDDSEFRAD